MYIIEKDGVLSRASSKKMNVSTGETQRIVNQSEFRLLLLERSGYEQSDGEITLITIQMQEELVDHVAIQEILTKAQTRFSDIDIITKYGISTFSNIKLEFFIGMIDLEKYQQLSLLGVVFDQITSDHYNDLILNATE